MSYHAVSRADKSETREDKVIPFPGRTDSPHTDTALPQESLSEILEMEQPEGRLKAIMEEALYEAHLKGLFNPPQVDDTVDIMHLGEPVSISKEMIAKLKKCAKIQDLSNTISFVDDAEA